MATLTRFGFEFDPTNSAAAKSLSWWGVTAWTVEGARVLISDAGRFDQAFPRVSRLVEGVDISTLDQNYVARNMATPNLRGIWYPLGFQ